MKRVFVLVVICFVLLLSSCDKGGMSDNYTIRYVDFDGTVLQTETYNYEDDLTGSVISDPIRDGHTFIEWDIALPETMPKNDITLTATYSINMYTITVKDNDGSVLQTVKYQYGEEVIKDLIPNPERKGYTFTGWDIPIPEIMPGNDITITATYEIDLYTVQFLDYDGTVLHELSDYYGADISDAVVDDPTREGHYFIGWDTLIPDIMPNSNIVITAKYDIIHFGEDYSTYFPVLSTGSSESISINNLRETLGSVIEDYAIDKYESKPNQHDEWGYDIDSTPEDEIIDYRVYKEDIEDVDVFEYNHSPTRVFYDELKFLMQVLGSVSENDVGKSLHTTFEYTTLECCDSDFSFYEQTKTEQGELYVLYGEDYIYAHIIELSSSDENDNKVYYVEFEENEIAVFKYYRVQESASETQDSDLDFKIINYIKGEKSKYFSVIDNEITIIDFDSLGNYKAISIHESSNRYWEVSLENETYFNSFESFKHLTGDIDYRTLTVYKDGVFQVEHRLFYLIDSDEFLELNNTIKFNGKYVEGWDYILIGYGEIDGSDGRYYKHFSGNNVGYHIISPYFAVEVNVELDGYINEDDYTSTNFENGENYSYDFIPFSDFITYWNSYENIWDNNGSNDDSITFDGTSYNISMPIQDLSKLFTDDDFEELLLSLGLLD